MCNKQQPISYPIILERGVLFYFTERGRRDMG
jgi:hypothetical protein